MNQLVITQKEILKELKKMNYLTIEIKEISKEKENEIMDDALKTIIEGLNLFAEGYKELMTELVDVFTTVFHQVWPTLKSVFNFMDKTMTKKKFKGMIQAAGIQRNEINKIVANNKDPYTYRRLNETLNLYKKEEE